MVSGEPENRRARSGRMEWRRIVEDKQRLYQLSILSVHKIVSIKSFQGGARCPAYGEIDNRINKSYAL